MADNPIMLNSKLLPPAEPLMFNWLISQDKKKLSFCNIPNVLCKEEKSILPYEVYLFILILITFMKVISVTLVKIYVRRDGTYLINHKTILTFSF